MRLVSLSTLTALALTAAAPAFAEEPAAKDELPRFAQSIVYHDDDAKSIWVNGAECSVPSGYLATSQVRAHGGNRVEVAPVTTDMISFQFQLQGDAYTSFVDFARTAMQADTDTEGTPYLFFTINEEDAVFFIAKEYCGAPFAEARTFVLAEKGAGS